VDTLLAFNAAAAGLKARHDPAPGLAYRQRVLGILSQALDASPRAAGPDLLGETAAEIALGLIDRSMVREANEIGVSVAQLLKGRAVAGDRESALALDAVMRTLTDALLARGHVDAARGTSFGHAMFMREIADKSEGDVFLDVWADRAALSIGLVDRDLGFVDAAKLAGQWHQHAINDLAERSTELRFANWLTILLAQDALYAAHAERTPTAVGEGLRIIARMTAGMIADRPSRSDAGPTFHFERAALAWLALALREHDAAQIDEALDLLDRTCAGVLPVARWESLPGLRDLILRLRSAAAALPRDMKQAILANRPQLRSFC
jgi:hypothetical protein